MAQRRSNAGHAARPPRPRAHGVVRRGGRWLRTSPVHRRVGAPGLASFTDDAPGSVAARQDWNCAIGTAVSVLKVVGPQCDAHVMSSTATSAGAEARPGTRLEVLFEELSELTGQRNASD